MRTRYHPEVNLTNPTVPLRTAISYILTCVSHALKLQDLFQSTLRLVAILDHPQQQIKLRIIIYRSIFGDAQNSRISPVDLQYSVGIECRRRHVESTTRSDKQRWRGLGRPAPYLLVSKRVNLDNEFRASTSPSLSSPAFVISPPCLEWMRGGRR